MTSGAQLDAISVGYEAAVIDIAAIGATQFDTMIMDEQRKALVRADAALAVFEAEAKNAKIKYDYRSVSALPDEAADIVGTAARLYDLSIVLQPDSNIETFDNTIPQEVLFQSGGPVLFIPHIHSGSFLPKHIGIAWDGSRLAARALRDAMPFLDQAQTIAVISVDESRLTPADLSSATVIGHLARRGLRAIAIRLTSDDTDIDQTILSVAADESLDLMVMGGYGHSRLQERFLGGVTRGMLQSMTLPALMSH
jgi:nucleotide-binding universal stress UspA family protein